MTIWERQTWREEKQAWAENTRVDRWSDMSGTKSYGYLSLWGVAWLSHRCRRSDEDEVPQLSLPEVCVCVCVCVL